MATPLEELNSNLQSVISEAQAIRSDVQAEATRQNRNFMVTIGALAVVLVIISLSLLVAYQVNRVGNLLADCTVAGGKCYEQQQERSATIINDIKRGQLYIVECSRDNPGIKGEEFEQKFEACVERKLDEARRAAK